MKLGALLEHMEVVEAHCDRSAEVAALAYDSRRVEPGDLFFGLTGVHHDGRAFVARALEAGAVAAVVDQPPDVSGVPWVRVAEPRRALAQAADALHGHPSRALTMVGITGTNGKTTTTYLLEAVFDASGKTSGVIGTTGYRLAGESRSAPFTTPESPELQRLLREMVERGVEAVALEISSHALVQRRAYGLAIDVAVFTNLGHDHLDYHGSLESYLDAKLMLFDGRNGKPSTPATTAVVNGDDAHAPQVIEAALRGHLTVRTFGFDAGAGVRIDQVRPLREGLRFSLIEDEGPHAVSLPLLGRHNASNAAAAFAAARALGVEAEVAVRGIESVTRIPGRLERVLTSAPFQVVVDYAHTPDSLSVAVAALREHGRGRVLLVFGCGGDRDRGKRALMGRIAAERSDAAWVTNDNPRSEDPALIAAQVVAGAPRRLRVELDRRAAIAAALAEARDGDTVLIAGKGHETTQQIGDRVLPFDDRAVARALLGTQHSGG